MVRWGWYTGLRGHERDLFHFMRYFHNYAANQCAKLRKERCSMLSELNTWRHSDIKSLLETLSAHQLTGTDRSSATIVLNSCKCLLGLSLNKEDRRAKGHHFYWTWNRDSNIQIPLASSITKLQLCSSYLISLLKSTSWLKHQTSESHPDFYQQIVWKYFIWCHDAMNWSKNWLSTGSRMDDVREFVKGRFSKSFVVSLSHSSSLKVSNCLPFQFLHLRVWSWSLRYFFNTGIVWSTLPTASTYSNVLFFKYERIIIR